jgi:hypothetical protein
MSFGAVGKLWLNPLPTGARLNIAKGLPPAPVNSVIVDADALLSGFGGKLPYDVRTNSPTGKAMVADAGTIQTASPCDYILTFP